MIGPVGRVTREPAPGVLDDLLGGLAPFRVERVGGGTMPDAAWTLDASTGAVTMDARTLAVGSYSAAFRVVEALGRTTPDRPIVFLVEPLTPVTIPDTPPVARPDRVTLSPGKRIAFNGDESVLRNDWDDGRLTAERVAGGTLPAARAALRGGGTFTVDAVGLAEGTYTFLYRARAVDGQVSDPTTVTVVVDNFNDCGIARDNTYSLYAGQTTELTPQQGVLSNDTDADGDKLRARLVGTFTTNVIQLRADGSIRVNAQGYAPGAHFQFDYHAVDLLGEVCNAATVRLNLIVRPNVNPVANDNYFEVGAGQTLVVPPQGVLGNDFDPDDPELALTAQSIRRLSGLSLRSDGSFTYNAPTSLGRYEGTYVARDRRGGVSAPAAIILRVVPVPDAPPPNVVPIAKPDLFYRVHADQVLDVPAEDGVLANDVDPDDGLIAEPLVEYPRFPLTREGAFVFDPTLEDIGKTFTYSYRAIEKGYTATRTPAVQVTIQVVAPRERCVRSDAEVRASANDEDGIEALVLGRAQAGFGWCHDRAQILRAGVLSEDGGFQDAPGRVSGAGRATGRIDVESTAVTDAGMGMFLVLSVQGDGADRGSAQIYSGGKNGQLLMRPSWKVCVNPIDVILNFVGKLQILKKIPYLEKIIDDISLGNIYSRLKPILESLDSPFLKALDGRIDDFLASGFGEFPGELGGEAVSRMFDLVLDWVADLSFRLDYPEEGTPWSGATLFGYAMENWDEVKAGLGGLPEADLDCLPIGSALDSGGVSIFQEAFAMYYVRLAPSDSYDVQGDPDGSNGLFDLVADTAAKGDLFGDTTSEVGWYGEFERTDVKVVGCNLTRTRPDERYPSPPQLPGDPPRTC